MPPRYPPIAPRAPTTPATASTPPSRIEQFNNLDALPDAEGYEAQLAALERDRRRFLTAGHPIKDALNLALQKPAGVLLQRYANVMRRYHEAANAPQASDEPGERQAGTAADADDRPAIVAFTETMVAKAILGDLQAGALVADRIEGKAGLRRADVDAETEAQRLRVRHIIGELVTDMVDRTTRRRPMTDITPDE